MRRLLDLAVFAACLAAPTSAHAAIDGAALGPLWAVPFAGMLMSIALFPLFAADFWDRHFDKIALFWALAFLVPATYRLGLGTTAHALAHTALLEYMPFIILLFALFTVAGGILIVGNLHGTPTINTALLAIGTVLRELHRHDRRVDAADPAGAPRQRRPAPQRPRLRLLHLPRLEHRRLADAARRPAAVPRLPARASTSSGRRSTCCRDDAVSGICLLADLLRCSTATCVPQGGRHPRDPTPDRARPHRGRRQPHAASPAIVGAVLASGVWKPGVVLPVFGIELELQNVAARRGADRDRASLSLRADAAARCARATPSAGGRSSRSASCSPASSSRSCRCSRCCRRAATAPSRRWSRWSPIPTAARDNWAYFWLTGVAVVVPRQRADLPRVLQPRGRRCRRR